MPRGESDTQTTTEAARDRAEYADRIRRTSERLALSVAALSRLGTAARAIVDLT